MEGIFFSAKTEREQALRRRLELRESLLNIWSVDINQALRMSEDRQAEARPSEVSCVSFGTE